MCPCKFLTFADLHFHSDVFISDSEWRIKEIFARAEHEEVDFIAFLGDFLHAPTRNHAFAENYHLAPRPIYGAVGNHDTDGQSLENYLDMMKIAENYYSFDRGGCRFIVLDPNYCVIDGAEVHFEPSQKRPNNRGYIPSCQLDWLDRVITESSLPCVLLSHQSLERTDGISNRDDVWSIIAKANRRTRYSVVMAINGHYHADYCTIVNDVCCFDLNSASYHWTDTVNSYYPPELYRSASLMNHTICYDKPLSAVIELCGHDIRINGCDGGFMFDPGEAEIRRLDQRRLCESRVVVPFVRSYEVDLSRGRVECV